MTAVISNSVFEIFQKDRDHYIEFKNPNDFISLSAFIDLLNKANVDIIDNLRIYFDESDATYDMSFDHGKLSRDTHDLYRVAGNRIVHPQNVQILTLYNNRINIYVIINYEPNRGYLLNKKYIDRDHICYDRMPMFGTPNLPKLIDYIHSYCNMICETGDYRFDQSENLEYFFEDGNYIIKSLDGTGQIILTIVPVYWINE